MISVMYASIVAVTAFVAGAFLASPEIRAYAAATIGSAEIIDESIQSVDIKDGEIRASDIRVGAVQESEIARDSVGASELKGVTKLIFAECTLSLNSVEGPGTALGVACPVLGSEVGDNVLVTMNLGGRMVVHTAEVLSKDTVNITLLNNTDGQVQINDLHFSIIVYDT